MSLINDLLPVNVRVFQTLRRHAGVIKLGPLHRWTRTTRHLPAWRGAMHCEDDHATPFDSLFLRGACSSLHDAHGRVWWRHPRGGWLQPDAERRGAEQRHDE